MKANELMIGDLVLFSGEPKRVKSIVVSDNGVERIYVFGNTCQVSTINAYIQPIPLTPEILEKNGFTHSFGDSDFYDYEKWEKKVDNKTIRVIKDHDGWFCRVDDNKLTRSMGIAPAVHTMQNIIRIGGIEKTIEL